MMASDGRAAPKLHHLRPPCLSCLIGDYNEIAPRSTLDMKLPVQYYANGMFKKQKLPITNWVEQGSGLSQAGKAS